MSQIQEKTREQVLQSRAAKRAHAESLGIDEKFISQMVERFYGDIRDDDLLGSIFAERIGDWPAHLEKMKAFWRSILYNSGEFSGNPMQKHIAISGLEERHFARWLSLFYANLRRMTACQEAVELVGRRARLIADSLLTGIATSRNGLSGARAGDNLPSV